MTGAVHYVSIDEVVMLARELSIREQNPQFRQVLLDEINMGSFVEDMQLLRHLEKKQRPPDIRRRKNITPTIHKHWETIVRLATEGRIFFGHSDLTNKHTLDFIETHVPEIRSSRNIIYTSNVVDTRYSRELNGLERFNLQGESWYVFTTQQPDDYVLKTSHQPPPFPGKL